MQDETFFGGIVIVLLTIVMFLCIAAIIKQNRIITAYEDQMTYFTRCVAFNNSADQCLYILIPKEQ